MHQRTSPASMTASRAEPLYHCVDWCASGESEDDKRTFPEVQTAFYISQFSNFDSFPRERTGAISHSAVFRLLYCCCCIAAAAAAAVYGCSIAVYGCSVAVYGCYLAVQGCSIAENAITIKPESSTAAGDARDVCSVYGVFRC